MDARVANAVDKLFDYAGTFPPASLPLAEAWAKYRELIDSSSEPILDRMVVAADDLPRLAQIVGDASEIEVSVLANQISSVGWADGLEIAATQMNEFQEAVDPDVVAITAIEALMPDSQDLDGRLGDLSAFREIQVFVEVPVAAQGEVLPRLFEEEGLFAKMRTGGSQVPSANELAGFLLACAQAEMPFKLTAGLHHAFSSGSEFGFMNVLCATGYALRDEATRKDLVEILSGPRVSRDESGLYVRDYEITFDQIDEGRDLLCSIGSCSIDEAAQELVAWAR